MVLVGTDLALVVLVDTGLVDLASVGMGHTDLALALAVLVLVLVLGLEDLVLVLVGRMVTWVWGWVGLASSMAQAGALARVASPWGHLAQAAMLSARVHPVSPTTPTTTGGDRTVTGGRLCATTCTSSSSPFWDPTRPSCTGASKVLL